MRNQPFDTGWNLILLLLLLTFKFAARIFFFARMYAGITVLTLSYMCQAKLCNRMYQVYMHLYAKIGDIILILQEQPSFKRRYKKTACIGKHINKLQASHNKLCNKCTSGRNSRVKSTQPRSSVISCTRKPRRFRNAQNHWKDRNQVGDWRW